MYIGVPAMMPLCEMLASSAARARPKSVIFTLLRPAFEQHVARLDVAVDQVGRMGGGQPLGDLPADPQHLGHVERTDAVEPLLERLAGDELHRQVGQRLLADLVHLHHVLVPDLRRRPGLAQEALAGRRRGGRSAGPAPSTPPRAAASRRTPGRRCRSRPGRAPGAPRSARSGRANRAGWAGPGKSAARRRNAGLAVVVRVEARFRINSRQFLGGRASRPSVRRPRAAEETAVRVMGTEQRLDPLPQPGIGPAGFVQVGRRAASSGCSAASRKISLTRFPSLYSAWAGLRRFPASWLDYNIRIVVMIRLVCGGVPGWLGIACN